ncbi:MAG: DUF456 domain-containing protein [Gemmatimonas sp.]
MTFSPGLAIPLLGLILFASLLLIPIGLPGLWLMLGAALVYWIIIPTGGIGLWTLIGASILVIIAEVLEFTIAGSYTRKYGGSRRASWGAIIGGIVGAIFGVPVPLVGSIIGAMVGAFVGAFVGELTVKREHRGDPTKVAMGAMFGRAVAAAVKCGIGIVVGVWIFSAAVLG